MHITNVYLIRHGEPEASTRGRCYGKLDVALSPRGVAQIQRCAAALANVPLHAIYSSPRKRALESANIAAAAKKMNTVIEPDLSEINFGLLDGLLYDDAARLYPEVYQQWMEHPTRVHFPEGESFSLFQSRVLGVFHRLLLQHRGESFALFSHGGINRTILASVLRMQDEDIFRLGQSFASMNHIELLGDFPVVKYMNREE